MRIVLLTFFTVSALLLTQPMNARAQTIDNETVSELQDMLAWMNQATEISVALGDLFDSRVMADIYASFDTGDFEAIRAKGRDYAAMRERVLPDIRAKIDALPPPERWNVDPTLFDPGELALFRAAKTQYRTTEDLYEKMSDLSDSLATLMMDLETLDDGALDALLESQQDVGIAMIKIENQQVRGYLVAIPEDNPNHQFQSLILRTNLAVIEELKIPVSGGIKARQNAGRKMMKALEPTDALIVDGRKNSVAMTGELARLMAIPEMDAAERAFLEKLGPAMASFSEQFDVETDLVGNLRASAELLMSDKRDDAITDALSQVELERLTLIDRRVNLFTTRLKLMQ